MIEFIAAAFIVAWKKGYKVQKVFRSWEVYLPLFFGLLYLFLDVMFQYKWSFFLLYKRPMHLVILLSFLVLGIRYKLYEHDKFDFPYSILFSPLMISTYYLWIGTQLNSLALSMNNSKMPIFPTLSIATGRINENSFMGSDHVLGGFQTQLIPFCDILDTGFKIFSIGDVFIGLYIFTNVYYSIKYSYRIIK